MSAAEIATALGDAPVALTDDYDLTVWQGRIASGAANGGGLDVFRAALEAIKQNVPPDRALLEHAKREIWDTAERHLVETHGLDLLEAIYVGKFPEDAAQEVDTPEINNEFDAATVKIDERNETDAEIRRLAKLSPIEFERERKLAAERLGIKRLSVLDAAVKTARAEHSGTRSQGRKPSIIDAELWPEPVNLADALNIAVAAYSQYLILPRGGPEKMALWSMGTHCFQEFTIFPRLAITSPVKECAKSLLLRVLKCTSARPVIMTNANIAPLFRMISVCRPSIFLDEADNYLNDKPDLLALLNDGYASGGRVWRCEGENNEVKEGGIVSRSEIRKP